MTDVSILGLGPMGAAIARAVLAGGHRATVWNRTAARAAALAKAGAVVAPSAAAAIAASPRVLICVADYAASRAVLQSPGAAAALDGRVLVQLSTGTPQDARDGEAWARQQGADYLDGALLATPGQLGRPDTPLFVSGARTAYQRCASVLAAVAGETRYMGEAVGAAAAWDLAALSSMFGAMFGFFHGLRICESEGLPLAGFNAMIQAIWPVLGEMVASEGEAVLAEAYGEPASSMDTCAGSGRLFVRQAREAGIDASFPAFASALFERALAAGLGTERLGAMMKVLRQPA